MPSPKRICATCRSLPWRSTMGSARSRSAWAPGASLRIMMCACMRITSAVSSDPSGAAASARASSCDSSRKRPRVIR